MFQIALVLITPLFTGADRFAGSSIRKVWTWLTIHPRYPAALAIAVGLGAINLRLAPFGLAWLLWRWPAWHDLGGQLAPTTLKEAKGELARHLLSAPGLIAASVFALWTVLPWTESAAIGAVTAVVFSLWATLLALWLGVETAKGRSANTVNAVVESLRCAPYGAGVTVVAYLLLR